MSAEGRVHAAEGAGHTAPEGPHLGPLTAGDPHVSIPVAVSSSPLARQPLAGFLTVLMAATLWFLVGIAFGADRSFLTIAAPSTYWLPVLIVIAVWWGGWPGTLTRSRPGAGLVNTVIFAAAALVLTGVAQIAVGKADFGAIVSSGGTFPTYPFLLPLAATIFVTMLQLTFVCDRWPFDRMKPIPAGLCAFVLCWAVGLLVYFTVINWNAIPAPARAAIGLRNPGGPVDALEFIGWLVCLVPYQLIFFQLLDGWPFRGYESKLTRLVTSNVFVIGAGWLTFLFLHDLLRWSVPAIAGALGMTAIGVNFTSVAFEDYPFHHEKPGLARFGLVMNVLGITFLAFYVLRAIGNAVVTSTTNPPVNLWVGVSGLNFFASMVILVYAVWAAGRSRPRRRPPPMTRWSSTSSMSSPEPWARPLQSRVCPPRRGRMRADPIRHRRRRRLSRENSRRYRFQERGQ